MSREKPYRVETLLYCWLFLSGSASLVYELVWMRLLRLVMGNSTASVAAVLAIYMAGLAIGSYVAGRWIDTKKRPILVYGVLQGCLGILALIVPWVVSTALPVFGWIHTGVADGTAQLALRLGVCTLLLIVPASLIGATFPAVASYFAVKRPGRVVRIGKLYAINSLGAVFGTLTTGFVLLPGLGLRGTNYVGIAVNLLIFASVVVAHIHTKSMLRRSGGQEPPPTGDHKTDIPTATTSTTVVSLSLVAVFAAGVTTMVFEVAWTRVLSMIIGSSVYAFTIILAAFIGGLSLGSFFSAKLAERWRRALFALALAQNLVGFSSLVVAQVLGRLPIVMTGLLPRLGDSARLVHVVEFAIVIAIVVTPAFFLGAMFPIALRIYARRSGKSGRASGTVSAINTAGSIIGSLLAVFVLIPVAGAFYSTIVASLVNVTVGSVCLAFLALASNRYKRLIVPTATILVAATAALILPQWNKAILSSGPFLYADGYDSTAQTFGISIREAMTADRKLLYYKDGLTATVSVQLASDGSLSMQVNGKTDASNRGDISTELFSAQLPILLHPEPRSALVIGLGSGMTLGSLERYNFEEIDCIEISPAVVQAASFFEESNRHALQDPRLNLVLGDGRHWVTYSEKKYDIITSEPSNPWIAGIGDLFTEEFFDLARRRLNDNGLMVQWIHAYSMSKDDFKTVVGTFASVFPYTTVWEASFGDYLLAGSMEDPVWDLQSIARRIGRPELREDLDALGIVDVPSFFSRLLIDEFAVRDFSKGAEINTDDNARLEFSAPLHLNRDDPLLLLSLTEVRATATERTKRRLLTGSEAWSLQFDRLVDAKHLSAEATIKQIQGRNQEAFEVLVEAHALAPRDPEIIRKLVPIHLKRGSIFLAAGDYAAALSEFFTMVELDPENAVARNLLGNLLHKLDRNEEARIELGKAIALNPTLGEAHRNLGETLLSMGRIEEARSAFQDALISNPDDPSVYSSLGNTYFSEADYATASDMYRQAIIYDSENDQAYYYLGISYYMMERWSDAREAWKTALQINPGNRKAKAGLGMLKAKEREEGN